MLPLRPGAYKTAAVGTNASDGSNIVVKTFLPNVPVYMSISHLNGQKNHEIESYKLPESAASTIRRAFEDNAVRGRSPKAPRCSKILREVQEALKLSVPKCIRLGDDVAALDVKVLRRAYVTVAHYLYYRGALDHMQVVGVAYLMCHTFDEADKTYNCLPETRSMYDDSKAEYEQAMVYYEQNVTKDRYSSVVKARTEEIGKELVKYGNEALEIIERYCKRCYNVNEWECEFCEMDLSGRAAPLEHSCYTKAIKKADS